jgi:ATP/ADP translocase
MKYLLLLLLLLLAAKSVVAQNILVAPWPDSLPTAHAATDTAAAIHRLFAAKRKTRTVVVVATLVGGAVITTAGFMDPTPYADAAAAVFGVEILAATITELLFYRRYSRAHEQKIIAKYQAHQPPKWLARKLHDSHFRSTSPQAAKTR